ncbi:hypothetical protein Nepgr_005572 [Nepenthes gracilis]|uniref:Uncharacterized protein n=1 Tax=Nepenthes gracilis TaxID=150966 RepID=A0AAD3XGK9_NEPGR|nr:hypothetical protein Nepgr_005572 [Nepenthes gracilis]
MIEGYHHVGLEGKSDFLCHVSQPIQRNPFTRELPATRESTFQNRPPAWQPASSAFKSRKPPGNSESQQGKHSAAQHIRNQEPRNFGLPQITWKLVGNSTSEREPIASQNNHIHRSPGQH